MSSSYSKRRSMARYSARVNASTITVANGQSPSRSSHFALDNARSALSQALSDYDPNKRADVDRSSNITHNYSFQNSFASSYPRDLSTNSTFKSEYIDDLSDPDSPPLRARRPRSGRKPKKRVAEEELPAPPPPSAFMLRLFDRSVDLSNFQENAPLYSLCRAWVRNPDEQATNDEDKEDTNGNDEQFHSDHEETDDSVIRELPPPISATRDIRIPLNLKKPKCTSKELDEAINSFENESAHDLMQDNKLRWKNVRKKWIAAANENEARYKRSLEILKEMYEKTLSAQHEMEL